MLVIILALAGVLIAAYGTKYNVVVSVTVYLTVFISKVLSPMALDCVTSVLAPPPASGVIAVG